MHREFSWPGAMDRELQDIEQLDASNTGQWLRSQQAKGCDDATIHLILALACARYVDHHGPFIGHGIFNGGPMLRAGSLLSHQFRNLALLQTAAYVVDLLRQPNYGPYLLMEMLPVTEVTVEASRAQLIASVESGDKPLEAEHRLVGLLETNRGTEVRWLLTEVALRQFHENEHRLLIVHRAAQLMDDTSGWAWVEPIFRAAVQYLATHPAVWQAESPGIPRDVAEWHGNPSSIESAVEALIEAEYGYEPLLLHEMAGLGLPLPDIVGLTGAEILCRSRFDAHAVTGLHCILDLVHDPTVTPGVRALAIETSLLGQRTRRQKELRSTWRTTTSPRPIKRSLEELRDIVTHDASGLSAMDAVGGMLLAGADARGITRTLMEVALTNSGPFEAIHNVKMLWGQLLETQRSGFPDMAWRHLAAGARVVAETTTEGRINAEPILSMWHSADLS